MSLLDTLLGYETDPRDYADMATLFGRTRVYDALDQEGDIVRVLDVANTWQSATYVDERWAELVFGYHRVFDRAFCANPSIRRALMLGGGALSYPKHVVVKHPDVAVDVIEVDERIITLAREWFLLDHLTQQQEDRLCVTCGDAVAFLSEERPADARYDLIVNDLFAARRPTRTLMSPKGAELIHRALTPEGLYVANVISALKGMKGRPLRRVEEALSKSFSQVVVVPLSTDDPLSPDNNVVFATNGSYSLSEVFSS